MGETVTAISYILTLVKGVSNGKGGKSHATDTQTSDFSFMPVTQ